MKRVVLKKKTVIDNRLLWKKIESQKSKTEFKTSFLKFNSSIENHKHFLFYLNQH